MRIRYVKQVAYLHITGSDFVMDSGLFAKVSEEELVKMGAGLFHFFLHDEYECKFRKMLTIEQFSNKELAEFFSNQYFNEPLKYQAGVLQLIMAQGQMKQEDGQIMALQLLEKHIKQFNRMYKE